MVRRLPSDDVVYFGDAESGESRRKKMSAALPFVSPPRAEMPEMPSMMYTPLPSMRPAVASEEAPLRPRPPRRALKAIRQIAPGQTAHSVVAASQQEHGQAARQLHIALPSHLDTESIEDELVDRSASVPPMFGAPAHVVDLPDRPSSALGKRMLHEFDPELIDLSESRTALAQTFSRQHSTGDLHMPLAHRTGQSVKPNLSAEVGERLAGIVAASSIRPVSSGLGSHVHQGGAVSAPGSAPSSRPSSVLTVKGALPYRYMS